jgi:hypothetical protein
MSVIEKSTRRVFLKKVGFASGLGLGISIPLLYQSPLFQNAVPGQRFLKDKELNVLQAFLKAWTHNWPEQKSEKLLENLDGVLSVVREDKRDELLLALKLLSFGPACYFLTGSFSPWNSLEMTKKVLEKWQYSQDEIPRKLYMSFSSLFGATYYSTSETWAVLGYPGTPDYEPGSAL